MNKKGTQRIETERLILRRLTPDDAEAMFAGWCNDPEVSRFLTWPPHGNVEVTRSILNGWIEQYDDGAYFNWGIELKDSGRLVGNISVVKVREDIDSADIGYCMSREFWGRGIMPEALRAVMDYLFDEVGMNRVAASHDVNNPKSGRVMEKAGMKLEGTLRQAGWNMQGVCDEVWHSMVKSER